MGAYCHQKRCQRSILDEVALAAYPLGKNADTASLLLRISASFNPSPWEKACFRRVVATTFKPLT